MNTNQLFIKYLKTGNKNINIHLNEKNFYYLTLHIKLSSLFYSTQLIDIFVYELPINKNFTLNKTDQNLFPLQNNSIIVYNFHSIINQQRFFLFVKHTNSLLNISKKNTTFNSINSITELFLNANWLEREASELHGIFFSGKKDVRNLMLPYGDTSAPMKKSFPSIGLREIFYDSITDSLIQNPVSIQF